MPTKAPPPTLIGNPIRGGDHHIIQGVVLRGTCPECGSELTRDLSDEGLSYPEFNKPIMVELLCYPCCGPNLRWRVGVTVELKLNFSIDVLGAKTFKKNLHPPKRVVAVDEKIVAALPRNPARERKIKKILRPGPCLSFHSQRSIIEEVGCSPEELESSLRFIGAVVEVDLNGVVWASGPIKETLKWK